MKLIKTILFLLAFNILNAQTPVYKNIIYAEGLGVGVGYLSVNYERLIYKTSTSQFYTRVGMGINYDTDWLYLSPSKSNFIYSPFAMIVGTKGIKSLKFEYGIGLAVSIGEPVRRNRLISKIGNTNTAFGFVGTFGLRYTLPKVPIFLKISYTPFYSIPDKGLGFIWGGASIGYSFSKTSVPQSPDLEEKRSYIPLQKKHFNDSLFSDKVYYSIMFYFPTTRSNSLMIGIERCQKINKYLSFTSSINGIVLPNHNLIHGSICLQPFHLLIGNKHLKFETGVSITYFTAREKRFTDKFIYNLYAGVRYNFKKIPWHMHLAYVPFIDPYEHSRNSNSLLNPLGFEFGIGYILHNSKKDKTSKRKQREQIMQQTKELR